MDVVSICRAYVDLVVSVTQNELAEIGFKQGDDRFLPEDQLQPLIDRYLERGKLLPGGPAANTSAMIAALGGQAAFIGKIANDELGKSFAEDFKQRGVTFKTNVNDAVGTACCVVLVTPDGERNLLYNARIADKISKADIELNKKAMEETKYLYIGLIYRVSECKDIVDLARKFAKVAKIVTGLQSYQSGNPKLAKHILDADIILGNEEEFKNFLMDLRMGDLQELGMAYPEKIIACTLGARGAIVLSKGKAIQIAAENPPEIKDTTGAGDAWAAGFLYGLSREQSLAESGSLGAFCAARILAETGGRPRNT